VKRIFGYRVRYEGYWIDALFLGVKGMESKILKDIFLGQGKYTVHISRGFKMEDCRMMATPMVTNLKKVVTSYLELVDPRVYRKLIGSLLYLVNTKPYICFFVNIFSQFIVELR